MPNPQAPILNPNHIIYFPLIPSTTTDPPQDILLTDTITIQIQWKQSSSNRIFTKVLWTSQPNTNTKAPNNKIGHVYNPEIRFSALGCISQPHLAIFIHHEVVGRSRRRVYIEFARATDVDEDRGKIRGKYVKEEELKGMDGVIEFEGFLSIEMEVHQVSGRS